VYTALVDVFDNTPKPPSTFNKISKAGVPIRVVVVVTVVLVVVVEVDEVDVRPGGSVVIAVQRRISIIDSGAK